MKDLVETVQGTELLSTDGFHHSLNLLVHMDQVYVDQNIEDNAGELHKAGHHHKMLLKFSDPHNTVAPITEIEYVSILCYYDIIYLKFNCLQTINI